MLYNEAEKYFDMMTREKQIMLLIEHDTLKQAICAQRLGVPTGADDWIQRAIERADQLRENDIQLGRLIRGCGELISEAQWRSKGTICTNCRGVGILGGESCCICHGTGLRSY